MILYFQERNSVIARERSDDAIQAKRIQPSSGSRRCRSRSRTGSI
jgi:hypothetical protein